MAPGSENGWERWRGEIDSRIDDAEDSVKALWKWRESHETEASAKYASLLERLTSVETKLIFFAAVAAAVGAMLPGLLAAIVNRI